jgi:hypothetical protein
MSKIWKVSLLAIVVLLLNTIDAQAQRRTTTKKKTTKKEKTDKYFDETGGFKHRLWYGGNFILNYSGGQGSSAFTIGATPMIGYKIIGGLSAGPRVGLIYTSYKGYDSQNQITKVGLTDYSVGAFARYKVFKNFFAHGEYGYASTANIGVDQFDRVILDTNGKPLKDRQGRYDANVGIGYNSGGLIGYEIALLYNLNTPSNSIQQPFDIRIGFTYNF